MALKRVTILRRSGSITCDLNYTKGIHFNPRQSPTLIACLYGCWVDIRPVILIQGGLRREPKAMNVLKEPLKGYLIKVDLNDKGERGLELLTENKEAFPLHLMDIVAIKDYYTHEVLYKVRGYYEPKLITKEDGNNSIQIVGEYKGFTQPLLLTQPITVDLAEIKRAYSILNKRSE